jgi:hypothetical protein
MGEGLGLGGTPPDVSTRTRNFGLRSAPAKKIFAQFAPRSGALFRGTGPSFSMRKIVLSHKYQSRCLRPEGRRVTTQANPFQYAEEVTRGESPRRSGDKRVHWNPVTFVTPTVSMPSTKCLSRETSTDSIEQRMDSRRKEPKR